ncbi:MAG: exodeoxyribonuclease VII large subunit [Xanthomonadaceae bacterium]|jgi:exodeoxyribonuclease VII large subunit|nr:exodeoxyribonuclease VII large subunit [Xanthomonadaceae bacterium]
MSIDPGAVLTPGQLNTLARNLLEDSFPLVWVEGELGNITRPSSGHLYFTLKDARAQVRCAMFRLKSQWLRFVPREGLKVLARGRLTLYEARGDYQLVLDHLEEAGEGALRRAYEELKARLTAEGLFDAERKRALPAWPRRLAVITSPTGAVIRDILSVLTRRFPLLEVEVLPTLVQGETAAAQIVSLLRRADAGGRYDAILLARGGGSLEDLWAFNDEALARAIAAASTPVVSAVGHETDFTLADFAADLRAPTPSVAAELLTPDRRDLAKRLQTDRQHLQDRFQHLLRQWMQRSDRAALRLRAQRPQARLQWLRQRQEEAGRRLHAAWREQMRQRHVRVDRAGLILRSAQPREKLRSAHERLERAGPVLRTAMTRILQNRQSALQALARALEAVSPLATVARGYAILTRTDNGTVIHSVHQVTAGDRLRGRVRDGAVELVVTAASAAGSD